MDAVSEIMEGMGSNQRRRVCSLNGGWGQNLPSLITSCLSCLLIGFIRLRVKTGDVLMVRSDVKSQFIGAAGKVQVAHVADVGGVEVQQFVAEQRLVAAQFYLAHLSIPTHA